MTDCPYKIYRIVNKVSSLKQKGKYQSLGRVQLGDSSYLLLSPQIPSPTHSLLSWASCFLLSQKTMAGKNSQTHGSLLVSSPWHLHLGLCLPPIPTQVFQALPKVSSDFGTRFHHLLPVQEQRISTSPLALLHPPHCTFCLTILFLIFKRKNFSQPHPLPLSVTTPLSLLSSVAKLPKELSAFIFCNASPPKLFPWRPHMTPSGSISQ